MRIGGDKPKSPSRYGEAVEDELTPLWRRTQGYFVQAQAPLAVASYAARDLNTLGDDHGSDPRDLIG